MLMESLAAKVEIEGLDCYCCHCRVDSLFFFVLVIIVTGTESHKFANLRVLSAILKKK